MINLKHALYDKRLPKKLFKAPLENVDTIRWLYKISPDTADFRRGDEIKELQILSVSFKNNAIIKNELVAIQRESPHPILFTAYDKWFIIIEGEIFERDKELLDGDTLNIEQRSAKLTDLYEDIVEAFIPIARKTSESIADFAVRYKRLQALEREITRLQSKVDNEKQPNKRMGLNEELKKLKAEKETSNG